MMLSSTHICTVFTDQLIPDGLPVELSKFISKIWSLIGN